MKTFPWIIPFCAGICITGSIFADGFSIDLQEGLAITALDGNQSLLYVNPQVENQYATSNGTTNTGFIGLGPAYQWDHIFSKLPHLALNLGLSAYYLASDIQGINTPGINLAPPGVTFDTLNYTATQSSAALMLEPKLIDTAYSWQPYVVAGIGSAWGHVSDYNETPNGTSVPNLDPFNPKTTANFAYSIGAGIQHQLIKRQHGDGLLIGLEYRYMSWSQIQPSGFPGQNTTTEGPHFGTLKTSLIGANLIWQF